jgi:hypothetical protein
MGQNKSKLQIFLRKHHCALILHGELIWFSVSEFWIHFYEDLFVLSCCSLKNLLRTKANAFVSSDYYESDIAWMDLVGLIILFSPFLCSYNNAPLVLILLLHGNSCRSLILHAGLQLRCQNWPIWNISRWPF